MDQESSNPYAAPASIATPPEMPAESDAVYVGASAGIRFANFIIDQIMVIIIAIVAGVVIAVLSREVTEEESFADTLITYGLMFSYYAVMEGVWGRTVGKFITGTKVVNLRDGKASFGQACLRSLCRFIPFEAFSFLGNSASGWHDSIPKTRVVKITPVQRIQPAVAAVVPGKPPVYRQPLAPTAPPKPPGAE